MRPRPDETRKNYTALALLCFPCMHACMHFTITNDDGEWAFLSFFLSGRPLSTFHSLFRCQRRQTNVSSLLLLSRSHEQEQSRNAMEIDQVIKAAEEIASGRQGPHYMVKILRSKLWDRKVQVAFCCLRETGKEVVEQASDKEGRKRWQSRLQLLLIWFTCWDIYIPDFALRLSRH